MSYEPKYVAELSPDAIHCVTGTAFVGFEGNIRPNYRIVTGVYKTPSQTTTRYDDMEVTPEGAVPPKINTSFS